MPIIAVNVHRLAGLLPEVRLELSTSTFCCLLEYES